MHGFNTRLLPLATLISGGLLVADAHAGYNPGSDFKAAYASDVSCFSQSSYGGIINNCSTAREVIATITVGTGYHPTSVNVYGNNTWCQTVTINGVGNGADVGPYIYTSAGPAQWQGLITGTRTVWEGTALTFRRGLEPGGRIGLFGAT